MSLSRRRFLGFAVGATAGTAAGASVSRTLADLTASMNPPVYPPRGREDFVLSVCDMCPGGCGVRARRIGGRVVKLEGNPLHPVNGGRLCPRGQAALQSLYHPDRVAGPMRRTGARGSIESFEPASWEEALGEIGERLSVLRQEKRPESLVLVRGSSPGIATRVAGRFMQAFGSPNDVRLYRGDEAASLALFFGQGVRTMPAFDLREAEYVLSLGSALLEAWNSPVHTMRAYGEFRQGRPGRRGKLVHVGPRLSMTAVSADEWIAVKPGSEGYFALGVAGALVAEGLYDEEFVSQRTLGVDDSRDTGEGKLRVSLRSLLEQDYSLERASAETGVSVDTILRIAREFAASRGPLAIGPRQGPLLPGPLFDHLAAQILNGLVGNLDQPGGPLITEEVPLPPWPDLPRDPVAEAGLLLTRLDRVEDYPYGHSDPERLAEAIRAGSPYPVEVLMTMDADPLFASASPGNFAACLDKVPLAVSFAAIPNDTALHADWILPEAHFLEGWDLVTTPVGVPYPLASLASPAHDKPMQDVRPAAQIFLDLARQIGGEVASAFPWKDPLDLIRSEVEGLYSAHRGAVMGTAFDEAWVRLMERAGWWAPGYRSAEELWERMEQTGGWWDPFYDHSNWSRVFKTGSGRHEFRTDVLQALREKRTNVPDDNGVHSLALLLFEPLPIAGGTGAELPFLQEILDPGHEERWETWAEIHPETAAALGVEDRDSVRIESPYGSILAKVRVTFRVVPEAVAIPVGLGRKAGGRWARARGASPLVLLSPAREPLSGLPDTGATRVRVTVLATAEPTHPVAEARRPPVKKTRRSLAKAERPLEKGVI